MDGLPRAFDFVRGEARKFFAQQNRRPLGTKPRCLLTARIIFWQTHKVMKIGRRKQDQQVGLTTFLTIDILGRLPHPLKMPQVMRTITLSREPFRTLSHESFHALPRESFRTLTREPLYAMIGQSFHIFCKPVFPS